MLRPEDWSLLLNTIRFSLTGGATGWAFLERLCLPALDIFSALRAASELACWSPARGWRPQAKAVCGAGSSSSFSLREPDLVGEEACEAVDAAVTAAVRRQLVSDARGDVSFRWY
jgi:hypothetical protein